MSLRILASRFAAVVLTVAPALADAGDCNCHPGGDTFVTGPYGSPFVAPAPLAPNPEPDRPRPPVPRAAPPRPLRWAPNAPPGTLGSTYRRPSRPVPDDEHPRTAMVEVRVGPDAEVEADDMEAFFGEDGLWHLTTERPLMPGLPHVVRVRVRRLVDGVVVRDVRVIRLIPGRIVSLDF